MKKLLCWFGFHKLKHLGYGGGWSYKISQCDLCGCGVQEYDFYQPFKRATRVTMKPKKFTEYLKQRATSNEPL